MWNLKIDIIKKKNKNKIIERMSQASYKTQIEIIRNVTWKKKKRRKKKKKKLNYYRYHLYVAVNVRTVQACYTNPVSIAFRTRTTWPTQRRSTSSHWIPPPVRYTVTGFSRTSLKALSLPHLNSHFSFFARVDIRHTTHRYPDLLWK